MKKYKRINYNDKVPYINLGPISNADIDNTYSDAILWALNNKDICNLAITGADGSGKSSVLKTFFKKYKNFKNINISLANFYAMDENENETEQVIEKSILQQLFYSVNSSQIPFSRFKRINKISRIQIGLRVILTIVCIEIGYLFYKPSIYTDLKTIFEENGVNSSCILLLLIFFTVIISYLMYIFIFYLMREFRLSKISFNKSQIEIEKDTDESIFNKYIDEIIYFFEETKYEIVIFEDLDRFKSSTKVFVKIRELNRLLNSTNISSKRIVFIYAVRDDLFESRREKTKFFDFIIPIIPINTFSNISSELKILFKNYGLDEKISCNNNFLNDMASFILDRRTLINIMNEFYVYILEYEKGPLKDFYRQLFVLIVYKNVKPKEYSKLIYKKSIIDKLFMKKQHKINYEKNKIEEKIEEIKFLGNNELQLSHLQDEIIQIEGMTLSEVINNYGSEGFGISENDYNDELYFIKKGYIDESYIFYLSYFAEGILSENDMVFYLSVKNRKKELFGYWDLKLSNIKHLIMMFNGNDYRYTYIYNYDLISFLLINRMHYIYQLNILGKYMSNNFSPDSDLFLILYRSYESTNRQVYELLCDFLVEKIRITQDDLDCMIDEYIKDREYEESAIFLSKSSKT